MRLRNLSSNNLHFAAIAGLLALVLATHADAAAVTVTDGWIRALPAGLPAAGYFELHNGTDKSVSLTGAASPACGMLMLHKSEEMGGMMKMEDVSSVDAAPGATVKFAPGGYHLMCMSPSAAIKPGAQVPVTLKFANGTSVQSDFSVRDASGK